MPEKTVIIVVGAGLMGTSIAYHLARLGADRVLVLEQGFVGAQGATAKSLGGIRTQFATEINVRFSLASKTVFDNFETEFGVTLHYTPSGYLYLTGSDRGRRNDLSACNAQAGEGCSATRRWPFYDLVKLGDKKMGWLGGHPMKGGLSTGLGPSIARLM